MIIWQFRLILLLLFNAIIFATILTAVVESVETRFKLSRRRSTILTLGTLGTLVISFVLFVVPPFINQIQELISQIPRGYTKFTLLLENPPAWLPKYDLSAWQSIDQIYRQLAKLAPGVFGNFLNIFSSSSTLLLQGLLLVIITLMLFGDPSSYRKAALNLVPNSKRKRCNQIINLNQQSLIGWVKGMCINSSFIGISCGVGLLFLQIPYVLSHALLAGMLNFIPNVGPLISALFPVAIALIYSPQKAVLVVVLYVILQQVESYWLSPKVMKEQVNLLPAVTLIAQIFFATFLGLPGLVLALPLTVVIKDWLGELVIKDCLNKA